jgi:hypothetical protein
MVDPGAQRESLSTQRRGMTRRLWDVVRRPVSLLLLLVVAQIAINVVWLRRADVMVGQDVANHTLFEWDYSQRLKQAVISSPPGSVQQARAIYLALFRPPEHSHYYWPPLVYIVTLPFTALLGHTTATTCYALQPFVALLLLSVFLLGRKLVDERAGLLAALLTSLTPMIFQSARQYAMDLPLTAAVTLCSYLLLRTRGFRDRRWSLLFGVALGASMLVKGQALIFLGPLAILALLVERGESPSRWSRLLNVGLCSLVTVGIAGHWWLAQLDAARVGMVEHLADPTKALEGPTGELHRLSLAVLLWQPSMLLFRSLGVCFALPCLGGVILTWGRALRRRLLLLHVAVLLPLVLFSVFFLIKHSRFLMPAIPPLLLLAATGLLALSRRSWRIVAVATVSAVGVVQLGAVSFVIQGSAHWAVLYDHRAAVGWRNLFGGSEYPFAPVVATGCRERYRRVFPPSASNVGMVLSPGFIEYNSFPLVFRLQRDHPQVRIYDLVEHTHPFRKRVTGFSHVVVGTASGCGTELPTAAGLEHRLGLAPGASHSAHFHLRRFAVLYREVIAELAAERDDFQLVSRLRCRDPRHELCVYRRTTWPGKVAGLSLPARPVDYSRAADHWVPFTSGLGDRPPPPQRMTDGDGGSFLRFSCQRPVCRYYLKVQSSLPEMRVQERVFMPVSTLWVRATPNDEIRVQGRFRGAGLCVHPHLRVTARDSSWMRIRPVAESPGQWLTLDVAQRLPADATAFGLVLDVEAKGDVDLGSLALAVTRQRRR